MVLAFLVYVMEAAKHFECRDVRAGVVYDTLAAVFDEVFEQLQCLDTTALMRRLDRNDNADAPCISAAIVALLFP